MDPAHRRALKLAIGTALALLYSQWVNWGQAYITAVLTATILALPLPAPSLRTAGAITVALMIALLTGLCLLLPIHYMAAAGVILIGLGLFGIFYYGARGGSAIIVSFMTIGLAVVPALGSESIDGAVMISQSLVKAIVAGIGFVWIAHAIFPESPETKAQFAAMQAARARLPKPDRTPALEAALRGVFVTFPVLLFFLLVPETSKYLAVLIKSATLGQQANVGSTAKTAKSMMLSTLIGGLGSMILWAILRIWPSLIVYVLGILLAGLVLGRRVFAGKGLAPDGQMWSYAYVTLLVILGPAVVATPDSGDPADVRFSVRIAMFLVVTFYGILAVFLFDIFTGRLDRNARIADASSSAEASTASSG
jgi:uncharacterized membrane protein YgaE (UPF0421/DUF939 family)